MRGFYFVESERTERKEMILWIILVKGQVAGQLLETKRRSPDG